MDDLTKRRAADASTAAGLEPADTTPFASGPSSSDTQPTSVLDLINNCIADDQRTANARKLLAAAGRTTAWIVLSIGVLFLVVTGVIAVSMYLMGDGAVIATAVTAGGTAAAVGGTASIAAGRRLRRRRVPAPRKRPS
jgi:hypothetical protein